MALDLTTLAETQIRELVDDFGRAVRARDLDGITRNYARDVIFYDAIPPLKYTGVDAYRKNWQDCFNMIEGPIGFEVRELNIHADEELGFAYSVNRVSGTMKGGKKMDLWFRSTTCFRRSAGKWLVTHEHASVPFYPETEKAATDLKP